MKWGENETRKVIITDHRDYFVFTVDSNQMTINGEKRTIDKNDNRVTAKKIGEEYYLPLRFTAELFGVKDINFDPVEKTVTLRFDEETEQSDKYYKREVNLKSGSNLRIDGKRYDLTANLEYKSGTLIPIEILLSAFGFFVSWESEDKLVFYKWNYLDLTKPRKIAGYFLVEKDYLVMDDKQIQLSEKSKKYNGKLYCSVGGYYTLDPISYIDWSASGANFYMYVPEDTHILSHTPKPFNRKVSMWYTTDDWNTEHAGEIIIDGDCYKESHEIKIINERYMLPGKVIMDAFGGEFMKNSDEFIMNIKSYKSSEGVPSTRIVTVKPVDSSYTVNGETEILDVSQLSLMMSCIYLLDSFPMLLELF
ncbi:MAG: stalk domain-containing protein [Caldisericia bacterium]